MINMDMDHLLFVPFLIFYELAIPLVMMKIIVIYFFEFLYNYKNIVSYYKNNINGYWEWSKLFIDVAGCKYYLIDGSSDVYIEKTKRCVFLLNHRSVFDFPSDCYVTRGNSMFIARYLNMYAAPIQGLYTYMTSCVYYFNRLNRPCVSDKKKFNHAVYSKLMESECQNINIYPEGTRVLTNEIKPIKKGGIHLAWNNKMRIQIIITRNKEIPFSAKTFKFKYGANLYCYVDKYLDSADYDNFDDFYDAVYKQWRYSWQKVYSGDDHSTLQVKPYFPTPYIKSKE